MSAIFGFLNLDGSPANEQTLKTAQRALSRRGKKFKKTHTQEALSLGFVAEHPSEASFYSHRQSGTVVVADARLDNRSILVENLNLRSVATNAQIIAFAFLKWGKDCPNYLDGDFAFAVWNSNQQEFFCARDRIGLKQILYNFQAGKIFAFATDAAALFAHKKVPKNINEARMLDLLVPELEGIDQTTTAFENVFRLPPASRAFVKNSKLQIERYWQLEPQKPRIYKKQSDYNEEYLEVFSNAVSARMTDDDKAGVMISGGMDSSSIAAIAARNQVNPIKSFSAINSADDECVETDMIRKVIDHINVEPIFVDLAKSENWIPDALSGLLGLSDPFDGTMTLHRGIYGAAKRQGVNVILDGALGDIVFLPGSFIRRQMRSGQFLRAGKNLVAYNPHITEMAGIVKQYIRLLVGSFCPELVKKSLRPWKYVFLEKKVQKQLNLNPDFVREHRLKERLERFYEQQDGTIWRDAYKEAAQVVGHTFSLVARERYDRVAGEFGIVSRDPFADVKMIEFCASLPPTEQKFVNGVTKHLMRLAMRDSLPSAVLVRLSKEHLGFKFTDTLLNAKSELLVTKDVEFDKRVFNFEDDKMSNPLDSSEHTRNVLHLWYRISG